MSSDQSPTVQHPQPKDEQNLPTITTEMPTNPNPNKTEKEKDKDNENTNPNYRKLETVVFINNSNYNMEIHTKHYSGLKVKSLISSDYTKWVEEYERKKGEKVNPESAKIDPIKVLTMHRMYYPEEQLFKLTQADWEKNQGKAYEIIITKEQLSWDDKPEFEIVTRPRPERPKKL